MIDDTRQQRTKDLRVPTLTKHASGTEERHLSLVEKKVFKDFKTNEATFDGNNLAKMA